jgi:hypothetical protein
MPPEHAEIPDLPLDVVHHIERFLTLNIARRFALFEPRHFAII